MGLGSRLKRLLKRHSPLPASPSGSDGDHDSAAAVETASPLAVFPAATQWPCLADNDLDHVRRPGDVESGSHSPANLGNNGLSAQRLSNLFDPKSPHDLQALGGAAGIAHSLAVDLSMGLADSARPAARQRYGANRLPKKAPLSLLALLWAALQDRTLLLLTAAAVISLAIGIYQDVRDGTATHWIEGAAILFAVITVVLVNALNDYQRELQFRKLNESTQDRPVNILRGGRPEQISIFDLAVGDIALLEPGDIVPADGVFLEGHNLRCDESGATGEADAIHKGDEALDPFLLSGTKVLDGTGSMLVLAVGDYSFNGRMMLALREEQPPTPLQVKLARLADSIARTGGAVALLMLITLTGRYAVGLLLRPAGVPLPSASAIIERLLLILIETITVVVVAVPEGLPMAVTLALAYATRRMLEDNNLVRVLSACETMGNATSICSDKTGTLTENRMTVVQGTVANVEYQRGEEGALIKALHPDLLQALGEAIAVNSTAFENVDAQNGTISFIGSKTEVALLEFALRLGLNYRQFREQAQIIDVVPFASERKSMSTIVQVPASPDTVRIHCKGASELILAKCTAWLHADGQPREISPDSMRNLRRTINEMAASSLRTIAIATRQMPRYTYQAALSDDANSSSLEQQMTLLALVGIEDPLRAGAAEAVATCQRAGIFVRMVTGDNLITAQSIAKKCGILMRGGLVMEGPRFRQLTDDAREEIIPRLQVLARSSPLDKQILVRKLRAMGDIVAVTGDGTNDGPALRTANVGFAMGIAGTEVAKEASSIVLLDDNFTSIVRAVAWGRCVNDSVKKFLQFQLTVNVSAVITAFASAAFDPQSRSILTAVQLLWVNLIMDTFAALALATDRPTPEILERIPEDPEASLLTPKMLRLIISQALFQVAVILTLLYRGSQLLRIPPAENALLASTIFNTFVFMQLFNEINSRILDADHLNPFRGILRNRIFLTIWLGTALAQVLLIFYGGLPFGTVPLPWHLWLASVSIASLSLPLALLLRLLPRLLPDRWLPSHSTDRSKRIRMTRERLQWQAAISDVRRSLAFFHAIRRARGLPVTASGGRRTAAAVSRDPE